MRRISERRTDIEQECRVQLCGLCGGNDERRPYLAPNELLVRRVQAWSPPRKLPFQSYCLGPSFRQSYLDNCADISSERILVKRSHSHAPPSSSPHHHSSSSLLTHCTHSLTMKLTFVAAAIAVATTASAGFVERRTTHVCIPESQASVSECCSHVVDARLDTDALLLPLFQT